MDSFPFKNPIIDDIEYFYGIKITITPTTVKPSYGTTTRGSGLYRLIKKRLKEWVYEEGVLWKKNITGAGKRKNSYTFILNSYENEHWFV